MKKLLFLPTVSMATGAVFTALIILALPALALAQTPPPAPTVAQVQQQWLIETGELRKELGMALQKLDATAQELDKAKADLKASDEALDAKDDGQ